MSEPLVSVVVPTFNRAYCIGRALDSALSQTHRNVEVIVIDDGSSDKTESLMREKYGNEPRVKYFKQANQGVTAARNAGLARVGGDFVALLDSDDVWMPWKLAAQIACMVHRPEIAMVWTDMRAIDSTGKLLHETYLRKMYSCWRKFSMDQLFAQYWPLSDISNEAPAGGRLYVGDVFSKMFMGSLVHTSTVLLRRDCFDKVKGFNEQLKLSGEDYDFHFRTCREGIVGFIDLSSIDYQTGMSDCLTQNKYETQIASNTLRTIELAYEKDKARIDLAPKLIRARFAQTHAWVGEALLDAGKAGARKHFVKSLAFQPWQPRTMRLLMLAATPRGLGDGARAVYRWMKKIRSRPGAVQQGAG